MIGREYAAALREAAEFFDALTHSREAHANVAPTLGKTIEGIFGYAFAVVANGKYRYAIIHIQRNVDCCTSRVAMHIGEPFLKNAEQCSFNFRRKAFQPVWYAKVGLDSAPLSESFDIPACGGEQTGFIKQRRMQ